MNPDIKTMNRVSSPTSDMKDAMRSQAIVAVMTANFDVYQHAYAYDLPASEGGECGVACCGVAASACIA
jgi:hypothetical protein